MFLTKKTVFPLFVSSFFIVVVFSVFWFLSLDVQWYRKEFLKLNVYDEVDKNMADQSISNILLYLRGKEPLNKNIFSPQAQYHLFDVKIIFQAIRGVLTVAVILNAGLLLYMIYTMKYKHIIKFFSESLIVTCAFLFFIGILILFFHASFEVMHKLIFVNDLWLFDPSDPLIQLLPEKLFFDLGMRIYIFSFLLSIFLLLPVTFIDKIIKTDN